MSDANANASNVMDVEAAEAAVTAVGSPEVARASPVSPHRAVSVKRSLDALVAAGDDRMDKLLRRAGSPLARGGGGATPPPAPPPTPVREAVNATAGVVNGTLTLLPQQTVASLAHDTAIKCLVEVPADVFKSTEVTHGRADVLFMGDVSFSMTMNGGMVALKEAVPRFASQMHGGDIQFDVAFGDFSTEARVFEAGHVTGYTPFEPLNEVGARNMAAAYQTGGGTDLELCIRVGLEALERRRVDAGLSDHHLQHLVIMTDGQPMQGECRAGHIDKIVKTLLRGHERAIVMHVSVSAPNRAWSSRTPSRAPRAASSLSQRVRTS